MQFCKIRRKELKSKVLYYTLFVYLVPMSRERQYLGLLGDNQLLLFMTIDWSLVTFETIIKSSKAAYSV